MLKHLANAEDKFTLLSALAVNREQIRRTWPYKGSQNLHVRPAHLLEFERGSHGEFPEQHTEDPDHGEDVAVTVKKPDDGWIEWNSGDCPVAAELRIEVKHRNGKEQVRTAGYLRWLRAGTVVDGADPGWDIVAYRLIDVEN